MTASAKHQLAGLLVVESVVDIALRALVESYPELHRDPRSTDSTESFTAAALVDLCGRLLAAIADHRRHVARRLPRDDQDWPF
jgi:formate dehydrogenase assembly factor FdhD